jgi:hypothetical protein
LLKWAPFPYISTYLQIDTDPDPTFHFDADPDPAYHVDSDPDPYPIFQFDADHPDPDPQHCAKVCLNYKNKRLPEAGEEPEPSEHTGILSAGHKARSHCVLTPVWKLRASDDRAHSAAQPAAHLVRFSASASAGKESPQSALQASAAKLLQVSRQDAMSAGMLLKDAVQLAWQFCTWT